MSRIPIKYKLTEVKISNGFHAEFLATISYRVNGAPTWTTLPEHTNVQVHTSGTIKAINPVVFEGLTDKTLYNIRVVTDIAGSSEYIENFMTNDNITVGESPIYLKKIYRGQQFTWFYDASPTGTDPLLNLESGINPTKQSSTWYYPLIGNFKEIGENWESFFFDENDTNQLFATKANETNTKVVTQGRTFLGTSSVKLIRTLGEEPGWMSSVEFYSRNTSYISFNFYLEDTNTDKIIFIVGNGAIDGNDISIGNTFIVKFDSTNKILVITNTENAAVTSFNLTDTITDNVNQEVQYNTWYTLRLNFTAIGTSPYATNEVYGVYAFLYAVGSDNKGRCVGKANHPTVDTFWMYNATDVGIDPNFGWASEQFAFGNPDNSTIGLTICRFFKGYNLPLDVLDVPGGLTSSNPAAVTGTVITSYVNLLKNLMFHKLVPNLTFTKTTSSGAVAPFREHVALQLGDTTDLTVNTALFVTTGAKLNSFDMNITLPYTVSSGYASQNALDAEVFIRGTYSKVDPNDTTIVLGTTTATASNFLNNTSNTLLFEFECGPMGGSGNAGRFHFEVVFKKGYITENFTLENLGPTFQPMYSGAVDGAGDGLNYAQAFGALIKDNAIGSRNGDLVLLTTFSGDRGVTGSQISLNAMSTELQITTEKHRCDLKWLGSVNPSTFNATVPPPPNQYLELPDEGVGKPLIPALVTNASETIPVNNTGETFIMGVENLGYSQADDATIEVGFPKFVHPKMERVTVLDASQSMQDSFDIDFENAVDYEAEKDKFYSLIDTLHTQWGGYNGGVSGDNLFFDENDKSIVIESHGDKYPFDGAIQGIAKGPKDHTFAGYGAPATIATADPNYALSGDKIKRRRVGSIIITKNYCGFGSFLVRMKLPIGMYGISPALWFFHYQEMYPTDPRWPYWIRRKATEWGNYLVVNNEIDMELPSQTAHGTFSSLADLTSKYFDKKVLDTQYRIGINNPNDANENGTYVIKAGTWNSLEVIDPVADPNSVSSWQFESRSIQDRVVPDMSNVKFNNWIGELNNGSGWADTQEIYEEQEDYMAKLTELSKLYADGEYHDWDIHWYPDRTELWVDGVFVRESRAFVPYNVMKYTFGLWFPSNREDKLVSGDIPWATDRGSWGGREADNEVSQMRINRIRWTAFPDINVPGNENLPNAVDLTKLEYFSESFPEAGVRVLSKL